MEHRPRKRLSLRSATFVGGAGAPAAAVGAALASGDAPEPRWGDYWERDQPFLGMVLDARGAGGGLAAENNLTPRGLVLRLEYGLFACFDTDLLRFSAVWRAEVGDPLGVTPVSMSAGSYHDPKRKAPPGQAALPEPVGELLLANAVHPGAAAGESIAAMREDPREPAPAPEEVGRGGLPRSWGRWRGVDLSGGEVTLVYEAGGTEVREAVRAVAAEGKAALVRRIEAAERAAPLALSVADGIREGWGVVLAGEGGESPFYLERVEGGPLLLRAGPGAEAAAVLVHGPEGELEALAAAALEAGPWRQFKGSRWPETVEVEAVPGDEESAVAMDTLGVPMDNPWRRNLRVAAVDFFSDGRAAAATYDGDVWLIEGWDGGEPGAPARWRRFAAGLHEPLNIAVHGDAVHVADRNGVQRLLDRSGDGEADWYECIGNQHGQTAETREFATGLEVAPDGSFILSKGGISSHSLGRHNGAVLRISPDGAEAEVLGWGFRMPFIGAHPGSGLVTASDQQGNWIPATPIHAVREGRYYGFLHGWRRGEPYEEEVEPPALWLPHAFNQSAVSQVWAPRGSMGALSGRLIHLGYEKSAVYVAGLEERPGGGMRGLVSQLPVQPTAALLGAAVSPRGGHVYLAGFRIWDSSGAPDLSNVFRLRPGRGEAGFATGGAAGEHGVRLDFADPLDRESAGRPGNYAVERWNYLRSDQYGSGHYRLDGEPGTEPVALAGAVVSADARSVFLALGDMRPAEQIGVTYTLRTERGASVGATSYLTAHDPLAPLDLAEGGFDGPDLEEALARAAAAAPLAPDSAAPGEVAEVSAEAGARLSELLGCIACHSLDGSTEGRSGPSWKGVAGSMRPLEGGGEVLADYDYLRESIYDPAAKIVAGYGDGEAGMPAYAGILSEEQVQSIVAFIETLQ